MKQNRRVFILIGFLVNLIVWTGLLSLSLTPPRPHNLLLPTAYEGEEGEAANSPEANDSAWPAATEAPALTRDLPTTVADDSSSSSNSLTETISSSPSNQTLAARPVPNTQILSYANYTSIEEVRAYVEAFGGQIVSEIPALKTIVVRIPANLSEIPRASFITSNEADYYLDALAEPNDPYFPSQWNLNVIHAPAAWEMLPANPLNVVVAVLDSGICYSHPDLQNRITATARDFVDNDGLPHDAYGHGCAVAGVIATNSNNALGVAGIAPNVKIMPLRVLDANGVGSYSRVAEAIVYAVDNGASIVNMSLGGSSQSTILANAVAYAKSHNVMLIAAAGNNGNSAAMYPAAYADVIAVGAIDSNLSRSSYSNYGDWVDLYAPGTGIWTSRLDGGYQAMSGTSLAAPHVAAVAALEMALGRSLVVDGGIVAVQGFGSTGGGENPAACDSSAIQETEAALNALLDQAETMPESVSQAELIAARNAYQLAAGPCFASIYGTELNIDSGAYELSSSEPIAQFRLFGTKWGADSPFDINHPPASPALLVTYSFMPRDMDLAANEGQGDPVSIDWDRFQAKNSPDGSCNFKDEVRQAFAAWSAVANIRFEERNDSELPFNDPDAVTADIRLGIMAIDGIHGELGHAYFPGPDPVDPFATGVGDMFLDYGENWGCETLRDDNQNIKQIDFRFVVLHEIGHAIGLAHQSDAVAAIMNPSYSGNVPTSLQVDDVYAVRSVYGSTQPITVTLKGASVNGSQAQLTWDNDFGDPEFYELQIAQGVGGEMVFNSAFVSEILPFQVENFPTGTLASGAYSWRVRAYNDGVPGPWSDIASPAATFTINNSSMPIIAVLQLPLNGEMLTDTLVFFNWEDLAPRLLGLQEYQIQIASSSDFETSLVFDLRSPISELRMTSALNDGEYFWRVRAWSDDPSGNAPAIEGAWSLVSQFRVDTNFPVNGSPSDGSILTTNDVTLTWSPIAGATEYEVWLDTSPNFVGLLYMDSAFLDYLFMNKLFTDNLFMNKLLSDYLFMNKLSSDTLFMNKLFMNKLFMNKLFMNKLFMNKLFMNKLFMNKLTTNQVNLEDLSEGYHYWRVRARRADGSWSAWSDATSFFIDTARSNIVISEISVSGDSWIEISNIGLDPVNIVGWTFVSYLPDGSEEFRFTFSENGVTDWTLSRGEYLVLREGTGSNSAHEVYMGHAINWPLNSATGLSLETGTSDLASGNDTVSLSLVPSSYELSGLSAPSDIALNESQDVLLSADGLSSTSPERESDSTLTAQSASPSGETPELRAQSLIIVTDTSDVIANNGLCSLSEAITNANSNLQTEIDCDAGGGSDTILIESGVITLSAVNGSDSFLPTITDALLITATSNAVINISTNTRVFYVNTGVEFGLSNLTLTQVASSSVTGDGGFIYSLGNVTIDNLRVTGFSAEANGGAIYMATGTTLSVTGSSFADNNAALGGAIFGDNANMTVSSSSFLNNGAQTAGGAIDNDNGGNLVVSLSTFDNNSSFIGFGGSIGGAIANAGALSVKESTFAANSADGQGGAIGNSGGTASIVNSTFVGNTATMAGGAIYSQSVLGFPAAQMNIVLSTFVDNSADVQGATLHNTDTISSPAATMQLKNSIVVESSTANSCENISGNTFNVFGTNFDTDGSCGGTTLASVTELQFDPDGLVDNGNGIKTLAILTGSVAINAASDCVLIDGSTVVSQDSNGSSRPQGVSCDVGAFEFEEAPSATPTPSMTPTITPTITVTPSPTITPPPFQTGPSYNVTTTSMNGTGNCYINICTLIDAINAANNDGVASTINLQIGLVYTLSTINNNVNGPSGLPVITSEISLLGNGSTIERSAAAPQFRIFLVNSSGNLSLNNVIIQGGSLLGSSGGGVANDQGILSITDSQIIDNEAGTGGGVFSWGTLTITRSIISGNTAQTNGGGLDTALQATVSDTLFTNNTATIAGGGLNVGCGGLLNIYNSTLSGNSALNGGGAQLCGASFLSFVTVANNSGGGVRSIASGPIHIKNSILADQVSSNNCSATAGGFLSYGLNLTDDPSCGPSFTVTASPLILSLSADGATFVHALATNSPAINAAPDCATIDLQPTVTGFSITNDQRGALRPQDNLCDVGAFEREAFAQTAPIYNVNVTDMTDDGLCSDTHCSLIDAINAANNDGMASTIHLQNAVTYTLTSANNNNTGGNGLPVITSEITIQGNASTIERDSGASESFRFFFVDASGNLSLNSVGLSNGSANGPAGAIYNLGTTSLSNCVISNNTAVNGGGAIWNSVTGLMNISGCTISGNSATHGGGIGNDGVLTITSNSSIANNTATSSSGGGIYSTEQVTIDGSGFVGNSAPDGGGFYNDGTVNITNTDFLNNTASASGGGLYNNSGSTATLNNTRFTGNTTTSPAIVLRGGGGIYNLAILNVSNSSFTNNSAPNTHGGAISNRLGVVAGNVTVTSSTFSNNNAVVGGAIGNTSAILTIINTTMTNNTAGQGGGIGGSSASNFIVSSTLAYNTATQGNNLFESAGSLRMKNSILVSSGASANCFSPIDVTSGVNFVTDSSCNSVSGPAITIVSEAALALGTLADNGGPVLTIAIGTGSVALDSASDCTLLNGTTVLSVDARGAVRPDGSACDAGAFEALSDAFVGCASVTDVPSTECDALIALYNSSNGAGWTNNSNWLLNDTVCSWYGVSCTSGHVVALNLENNNLQGSIAPELSNLSELQTLHLFVNELSGSIPSQLGNLNNLRELHLVANQLTGSIPTELGNLSNLTLLDLSNNLLSGSIPSELGSLSNLQFLGLARNQLTGSIPASLGSLSELVELYLFNNQLTGNIPATLGTLAKLEKLHLYANQLSGTIPASLGSLSSLKELHFSSNLLSGSLPSELGNLSQLTIMNIAGNQLSGSIPSSLGGIGPLQTLDLSTNQLTGSIPSSLGSLSNLVQLYLSNNQLSGSIPTTLGSLNQLEILWLASNQLTGSIPIELGSLSSLRQMHLAENQLTGSIPTQLGNLQNLTLLNLAGNQLSGSIPSSLGGLGELLYLRLANNALSGTIPPSLGSLSKLQELYLHNNELSGTIPTELGSLSKLISLYLYSNNLSGSIPPSLGSLGDLKTLSVLNNQLTGSIPTELGNLSKLVTLQLEGNQLSGTIPSSLGSLSLLTELRLNQNQLSGSIPPQLGDLSNLQYLRLDQNRLTGSIPSDLGDLTNLNVLYLNSNALSGEVPLALTSLSSNLDTLNIGYNMLFSSNDTVIAFLDSEAAGWELSQTIAPSALASINSGFSSIELSWTAIDYTTDGGYYEIGYSTTSGGPYTLAATTDKTSTSHTLVGLQANTSYFIVIRSFTPAHGSQQNALTSDWSAQISVVTSISSGIYTVTTPHMGDDGVCSDLHCSLVEAIHAANNDGIVSTILLADNMSYIISSVNNTDEGGDANGLPVISSAMTIEGNGSIILRSGPDFRIFYVNSSGNLTLNAVTISNGRLDGQGGGIYNAGLLTLNNSSVINSSSGTFTGGGIRNTGTLSLNNSSITGNNADSGGGLHSSGQATIINSVFNNNIAVNNSGGAITNGGTLLISGSSFDNNRADVDGGAIDNGSQLNIDSSSFSNNEATIANGGAIFNAGSLSLSNSSIAGNTAVNGGGIFNRNGALTIDTSTISNNSTSESGAGIWNESSLTLSNSSISGNTANGSGGGLYHGGGTVSITGSTFSGNSAQASGGAIRNEEQALILTNSTLTNNTAGTGAGISAALGSNTILSSTIVDNNASFGNNLSGGTSSFTIKNSIIAMSDGSNSCAISSVSQAGVNFASDSSCGTGPRMRVVDFDELNLQPLSNNGGATQTMALGPLSVAIDAATDCTLLNGTSLLTTDQRGFQRPAGVACEAGAYETGSDVGQAAYVLFVTSTEMRDDGLCGVYHCSLIEAINQANSQNFATSIVLSADANYLISQPQEGNDGFPSISSTAGISIVGNGASISRSGMSEFRFFHVNSGAKLILRNLSLSNGLLTAENENGGAVFNEGRFEADNVRFLNNHVPNGQGGAIFSQGNQASVIQNSLFQNNSALMGGAISSLNSKVELADSLFISNIALNAGGGLYALNAESTIRNSTFFNNRVNTNVFAAAINGRGGAIFSNAKLTLSNSSFVNNSASKEGSAIALADSANAELVHVTLLNNARAISTASLNVGLYNSLLSNPAGFFSCEGNQSPDPNRGKLIGAGNVASNSDCQGILNPNGSPVFTLKSPSQLDLMPLANYGGLTPTVGLEGTSELINFENLDVAHCESTQTDQRGLIRDNYCDIGAFEYSNAALPEIGTRGGAVALLDTSGETADFVIFGNASFPDPNGSRFTGGTVSLPLNLSRSIGRDPNSSDTEHRTDWLSQRSSRGGQNLVSLVVNEVFTGSEDSIEIYNPSFETVQAQGWVITIYDRAGSNINPAGIVMRYQFPTGFSIAPDTYLILREGTGANSANVIYLGFELPFDDHDGAGAVEITNGVISIDFMRFGATADAPTEDPGSFALHTIVPSEGGFWIEPSPPSPSPNQSIGRDNISTDTDQGKDFVGQWPSLGERNIAEPLAANDLLADATEISAVPYRDTRSIESATISPNDPPLSCRVADETIAIPYGHSVWYRFRPQGSGEMVFQTEGSNYNTVISIWTLDNTGHLLFVGCNVTDSRSNVGSNHSYLAMHLQANTSYYIMVGSVLNTSGNLVFSVQPPPNDNFNFPETIDALPYTDSQITIAASHVPHDPLPSCANSIGRTVWYEYTAQTASRIQLLTAGTNFDAFIAIYAENAGQLQEVACANHVGSNPQAYLDFQTVLGQHYRIMVGGNNDTGGNLVFQADLIVPPPNDDFANAIDIGSIDVHATDNVFEYSENTIGATDEETDPAPSAVNESSKTVWFQYTASSSTPIGFDTAGSEFDTVLSVWVVNEGNFVEIASDDDSNNSVGVNTSQLTITPIPDQNYYIMVSGYLGESGHLDFRAYRLGVPPENDFREQAILISQLDSANPLYDKAYDISLASIVAEELDSLHPTCISDTSLADTVWFKYVVGDTASVVRFQTAGSSFDTVIAVWVEQYNAETNTVQLLPVACNDDALGSTYSDLAIPTGTNAILYIQVGAVNGDASFLNFAASFVPSPPAHDERDHAKLIDALPYDDSGSNILASSAEDDPAASCSTAIGETLWYLYKANTDALILLDTEGSDFDTVLAIYEAVPIDEDNPASGLMIGAELACNNDAGTDTDSFIEFSPQSTKAYFILLAGENSANGNYNLTVRESQKPANDELSGAISLNSPSSSVASSVISNSVSLDTRGATSNSSDPIPSCNSVVGRSVWYRYTTHQLPANSSLSISSLGSNFNTVLTLYDASMQELSCADNTGLELTESINNFPVQANSSYILMVTGAFGESGSLQLSTELHLSPNNDSIEHPIPIEPLPFSHSQNTSGASQAVDDPLACGILASNTIWFSYEGPSSKVLNFSLEGTDYNTVLAVYTGSPANLQAITCSVSETLAVAMDANTAYLIMIGGTNGFGGNLQLHVEEQAPPSNDGINQPKIISSLPYEDIVETNAATSIDEPSASCALVGKTVWYQYTAQSNDGILVFDSFGSDFATVLAVYSVSNGNLNELACSDTGSLRIPSVEGATYLVMVGGVNGAGGNLHFHASQIVPPPNDDFANAALIEALPYQDSVNTQGATDPATDPIGCVSETGKSVWYAYQSLGNGTITISTSGYTSAIAVFTGDYDNLNLVACGQESLDLNVTTLESYYILITDTLNQGGPLTLTVTGDVISPPPSISMSLTASPSSVDEPGGLVEYSALVTNTSSFESITVTSLNDDTLGAINSICALPKTLLPSESLTCSYEDMVLGQAFETVLNALSVNALSDTNIALSASAEASVSINNLPSSLVVTKIPDPSQVVEPGGLVNFTVTIRNTSLADVVTINSVSDSVFGDVSNRCVTALPTALLPSQILTCLFNGNVSGEAGDIHVNTVHVEGIDDDNIALSADASASVTLICDLEDVRHDLTVNFANPYTSAQISNRSSDCSYQVGIAVYAKVDNGPDAWQLREYQTTTLEPSASANLSISALPACRSIVIVFAGDVLFDEIRYQHRSLDQHRFNKGGLCAINDTAVIPLIEESVASPENLLATSDSSSISLIWQDAASNETHYYVERLAADGLTWQTIGSLSADANSYVDTNVLCGTDYRYRIWAANDYSSSNYSNEFSISTLACATSEPDLTETAISTTEAGTEPPVTATEAVTEPAGSTETESAVSPEPTLEQSQEVSPTATEASEEAPAATTEAASVPPVIATATPLPPKIVICRATGPADEPANWVVQKLPLSAFFNYFDEFLNPLPGHENTFILPDEFAPCPPLDYVGN